MLKSSSDSEFNWPPQKRSTVGPFRWNFQSKDNSNFNLFNFKHLAISRVYFLYHILFDSLSLLVLANSPTSNLHCLFQRELFHFWYSGFDFYGYDQKNRSYDVLLPSVVAVWIIVSWLNQYFSWNFLLFNIAYHLDCKKYHTCSMKWLGSAVILMKQAPGEARIHIL